MKNDYTLRAVLENPPRFEFVTPDGTQYLIDEECVRDLRAMMTRAVQFCVQRKAKTEAQK